ncbi:cell division protein FtsJ [Bacillus sp. FJAT-27264]|uniref:cyclic-phosphate processing receiver domain-containing protein n=1 Tax=Paenibacillus sp. (strain DSM 101736 / FJAT-27264) TaxID=1850362 RepID=UPI000807F178|nr:cyclic-phosphate processing receiver domain-containing protein [Bacillus sp. FJAT-27264]OBZ18180.1 cell division protein FtsJ [Bacillus sp. FJAT-27264]
MINVYMDDYRKRPEGFALARTTEECLILLRDCEVDILSLDYDMGPDDHNGGEVAKRIVLEGLFPRSIFLHTSSPWGRKEMFEILYPAKPDGMALHNGPLSSEQLQNIASGADAS